MTDYFGDCPCPLCSSTNTYMMGFDGDEGIEDWECWDCNSRFQDEQMIIPSAAEYLDEFWDKNDHLMGKARLEAKRYVRQIQKAYEANRDKGEWYE